MHLRPFFSLLLAGAFVVFGTGSAFAQADTLSTSSGYVEFSFDGNSQDGGTACTTAVDNIVWGTSYIDLNTGAVCTGTAAADDDNIVWGTAISPDDNIVWGTAVSPDDNIVWGTALSSDDNIVWGTSISGDDNIVWGTAFADDNIVWGTSVGLEY